MLRNYFKVTIRNFVNQKYYSFINTVGLALGIAACILILLFVQNELSYEQGFKKNKQTYRLVQDFPMGNNHVSKSATVPFPTKNTLVTDFPAIDHAVQIYRPSSWGNASVLKYKDEEFFEDKFMFAEHSFFEIFDLNFIKGDPSTALMGANQLLITASTAKKYFGDEDPIGKTLNLNNFRDLEVVAVVEDLPATTHIEFDMIASFETFKTFFANNPTFFETNWVWVAGWLYFTVESEEEAQEIDAALPEFVKKHYPEALADKGMALHLQKTNDIHLTSDLELEFKTNGNINHVYLFSSIAILILLIAVINFMNLATSRAAKRGKEVGLRKVMGANKEMLVAQFMGEAILTTMLSIILAVGLIYLAIPWFNELTGKEIVIDLLNNTQLLFSILGLGLFVGLLSGSYPAIVMSTAEPVEVLKGKSSSSSSSNVLRKVLVISQFVISICLIICIGIVDQQLRYINDKDIGFDQEQILVVDVNFNIRPQFEGFKNELLANPAVASATFFGGSIPGSAEVIENAFTATGSPSTDQQWFSTLFAGHDFEQILDIEFIEGHSFQVGNSTDSAGFIINEAAAKALGWESDVLGRSIDQLNSLNGTVNRSGQVIGLVKDFHYQPLYNAIKPLVIRLTGGGQLAIKLKSKDLPGTVTTIEEQWNAKFEGNPFRYSFMDENLKVLYSKEDSFSRTIQYFSMLAIFIACLGLLGLSSFATESRRKEIGIRKVNGASTMRLVLLLIKDFSMLILIAFVIAVPVAFYFGEMWLNNFAYRSSIGITIFVIAGVSALAMAIVTVSYHTISAALTNPVNSLRND
jgi:putative ABC transport system permease protein